MTPSEKCWIHSVKKEHSQQFFFQLFSWLHQETEPLLVKSESIMLNLVREASQKVLMCEAESSSEESAMIELYRLLKVLQSTQVWKMSGNSLTFPVTNDVKVFISFNRVVENSNEYIPWDSLSKVHVFLYIINMSVNKILYLCCRSEPDASTEQQWTWTGISLLHFKSELRFSYSGGTGWWWWLKQHLVMYLALSKPVSQ